MRLRSLQTVSEEEPALPKVIRSSSPSGVAWLSLEFQLSLVSAIHEASPDGILVVNDAGTVVSHNRRFLEVWRISREELDGASPVGKADAPLLNLVVARVKNPQSFVARVNELYADPGQDDDCEVELTDGRTLERHSTVLAGKRGKYLGRVWFFRDISRRKDAEAALRKLAERDPLTGVANRRLFFERASQEISRARRTRRPLSLLMFDVDWFKNVNDRYGHAAGDEVLKMLTRHWGRMLRQTDVLGRVGGEEFAMLLPETALPEAHLTGERLRKSLEQQVVVVDGRNISCTVSAGVAALNPDDASMDDCMRRADEALYRAKRNGRNRTEDSL